MAPPKSTGPVNPGMSKYGYSTAPGKLGAEMTRSPARSFARHPSTDGPFVASGQKKEEPIKVGEMRAKAVIERFARLHCEQTIVVLAIPAHDELGELKEEDVLAAMKQIDNSDQGLRSVIAMLAFSGGVSENIRQAAIATLNEKQRDDDVLESLVPFDTRSSGYVRLVLPLLIKTYAELLLEAYLKEARSSWGYRIDANGLLRGSDDKVLLWGGGLTRDFCTSEELREREQDVLNSIAAIREEIIDPVTDQTDRDRKIVLLMKLSALYKLEPDNAIIIAANDALNEIHALQERTPRRTSTMGLSWGNLFVFPKKIVYCPTCQTPGFRDSACGNCGQEIK